MAPAQAIPSGPIQGLQNDIFGSMAAPINTNTPVEPAPQATF